jgi:Mg-dependent DNase
MLAELKALALEAKESGFAVAFGEFGLDYDRLFLSAKEPQLKYFEAQLDLAVEIQLPLSFTHERPVRTLKGYLHLGSTNCRRRDLSTVLRVL